EKGSRKSKRANTEASEKLQASINMTPVAQASATARALHFQYHEQVDFEITGKVTDVADGFALPGVNVLVKGTSIGTTTDADGTYRLNAPDGNVTLVFSFIGYTTQEVSANSRSVIDVQLTADI